ncbi:MAG: fumarylacetoacetate hydrolase family protein [Nitrosopumilus sp.]|nr:fumarylacetoacetate hydrolase family protein [Nitrosopumilus sp.]MDA7941714.1 fumarylacetoacetate hydrolase family protein [Nitrosopumilus sp.]MDA7943842.1 fumarylacetoacetate hydrolase family protein [Nitrosopumilus sp.]MDA7957992.1 fumarylacetoacetate hydrolase family protein [Nitrosopumilus sp.]MDA7959741.1 fumarylacetoacetate hydrolase family protein [Nitrosopumilus sp.]
MRIARIRAGGAETYGLVRDGRVATREEIAVRTGVPVPDGMRGFLFDGWPAEVERSSGRLRYETAEYELLAPVQRPGKIICLAFNYEDHAREQGIDPPDEPAVVLKPPTALAGPGSDIVCPAFAGRLDYEAELAVVIGRDCKDVAPGDAMGAVLGYMVLNDVSAREIQERDGQFGRAKGFDTFAPCGPWITTADEAGDPQDLRITTRVNGETRQDSSTSMMHVKIPEIISGLSRVMTLERGDVISTGTPAGVALGGHPGGYLRDGDLVEAGIEGLGTLRNRVRITGGAGR